MSNDTFMWSFQDIFRCLNFSTIWLLKRCFHLNSETTIVFTHISICKRLSQGVFVVMYLICRQYLVRNWIEKTITQHSWFYSALNNFDYNISQRVNWIPKWAYSILSMTLNVSIIARLFWIYLSDTCTNSAYWLSMHIVALKTWI